MRQIILKCIRLFLLIAFVVTGKIIPAYGTEVDDLDKIVLSTDDFQILRRIEENLNKIKTFQASFKQINHDGQEVTGQFYLKRPGKMRINYDPPSKDFVVATGKLVFYWDDALKQQSHTTIGSTISDILLRDPIQFEGRVRICDFQKYEKNYAVCLIDMNNKDQGMITLYVDDISYDIKKWIVIDALGYKTEVRLSNPQYNISLKSDLFTFSQPDWK